MTSRIQHSDRFSIYESQPLALAKGAILRITQNGTTEDGKHRLNNGAIYKVRAMSPNGQITLTNGWKLASDFGHVAHGYCVTSHSSQGKTVDRVFIAQSSESGPAASREQFYVSVSRGREAVAIYTDDKEELKRTVFSSDERMTALDLEAIRSKQPFLNETIAQGNDPHGKKAQRPPRMRLRMKPSNTTKKMQEAQEHTQQLPKREHQAGIRMSL